MPSSQPETRSCRILYRPSGALIAEGRPGWHLAPFDNSFYISSGNLREGRFETTAIPGVCPYKGLYLRLDYIAPDGSREVRLTWRYWIPNPLFPFIAWRIAIPQLHSAPEVIFHTDHVANHTTRPHSTLL